MATDVAWKFCNLPLRDLAAAGGSHLGVEDHVLADVTLLQLERLDEAVNVVVPDLGHQRFVWVDPHFPHSGLFPQPGLAVEPFAKTIEAKPRFRKLDGMPRITSFQRENIKLSFLPA